MLLPLPLLLMRTISPLPLSARPHTSRCLAVRLDPPPDRQAVNESRKPTAAPAAPPPPPAKATVPVPAKTGDVLLDSFFADIGSID